MWLRRSFAALLLPLAALFLFFVWLRRRLYRSGVLATSRLSVPVIVIGNITVGGAGKTPLVLYLAQRLLDCGRRPGIVSRGYLAESGHAREVLDDSTSAEAGDEALLLKRRLGNVPVFVGHRRAEAGVALLSAYPQCDVLLCDDGLQHYALQRDIEIAVFDQRGAMNGWMLPAGPLRETVSRLREVDALVVNGTVTLPTADIPQFRMRLVGESFYRLDAPTLFCHAADISALRLHAVAGIGEPQRFFDHLAALGLQFEAHAFADHHRFSASDLDLHGDALLMTEKDAVKCLGLTQLPVWVLPVDALLEPDLSQFVLKKLGNL
jgi:tetraacyldisaccharide 4'-kinase